MGIFGEIFGEKCKCGSRTCNVDETGTYKCDECERKEKMKKQMALEKVHKCPVDGAYMKKEIVVDSIIIDRCPKCHGVWLDSDELDKIKERIEEDADGGGSFVTGFAAGMIIG